MVISQKQRQQVLPAAWHSFFDFWSFFLRKPQYSWVSFELQILGWQLQVWIVSHNLSSLEMNLRLQKAAKIWYSRSATALGSFQHSDDGAAGAKQHQHQATPILEWQDLRSWDRLPNFWNPLTICVERCSILNQNAENILHHMGLAEDGQFGLNC